MFQKIVSFVREAYAELKRVTWPTRKEIGGSTLVVVVVVGLIMLCIGFFDFFLSILVKLLVR